ncbi:hypothetical protein JL721_3944 [Aureococcus anophagefferens]|nr:hypothetical protein JL721_3944 [Aureococcus anophagefferens]
MEACIPLGWAADDELAGGRSPPPPQASTSEVSSVAAGDLPCDDDEDREAAPEDGAGAAVDEAPGEGDDGGRAAAPTGQAARAYDDDDDEEEDAGSKKPKRVEGAATPGEIERALTFKGATIAWQATIVGAFRVKECRRPQNCGGSFWAQGPVCNVVDAVIELKEPVPPFPPHAPPYGGPRGAAAPPPDFAPGYGAPGAPARRRRPGHPPPFDAPPPGAYDPYRATRNTWPGYDPRGAFDRGADPGGYVPRGPLEASREWLYRSHYPPHHDRGDDARRDAPPLYDAPRRRRPTRTARDPGPPPP